MTGESSITSEDYADFIIDYRNNPLLLRGFENAFIHIMNDAYAIIHMPLDSIPDNITEEYSYSIIPKIYGLVSDTGLEASGVSRLRNLPNFSLTGSGVLVGIVDTGIDYINPVFRKADGTTKIVSLWDQTIESVERSPYESMFGTEYSAEQMNEALLSDRPLEIVPSVDEIGHGTMMAGIAVGTDNTAVDFQGVAPDAELVIVKLKQAKAYLKEFFLVPDNVVSYPENYIMWGVQYCLQVARQLGRPLALCLGIGTSQTAHDGRSHLSNYLSILADFANVGIVTPAGNEGNLGRHYYGTIPPRSESASVELLVGDNDSNFSMELWGQQPGLYSIDVLSPNGEYKERIPAGITVSRELSFVFESTIIYINYQLAESLTGDQLILLRFRNATPGIWRFTVYSQSDLTLGFHMWLPMGNFISDSTYFVQPNMYTTVLTPGTAFIPLTMTAYNPINNSLYVNASRGYTTERIVKPDLAAPGVDYMAPILNGEFAPQTGTSVAAAHTAGVVALFLEWAVVRGNDPGIDSIVIKNYFIRGARREGNLTYPNRDWGFGILDLFNVFDILRRNF